MSVTHEPRGAAALGTEFPYSSKLLCYVEVGRAGEVSWGAVDQNTVDRVRCGDSRLFAVWPGQWSSQLFAIDDLDECAKGLGLVPDANRTGLIEHHHEIGCSVSRFEENLKAPYLYIELQLTCGCTIKDLKTFAQQMRQQRGWDVATSSGWGSSGGPGGMPTYSVRVRRKSLT